MRLAEPGWLILATLALVPVIREHARPRVAWPTLGGFDRAPGSWASRLRFLPIASRVVAIACLAVALARPQTVGGQTRIAGQGVAIVVALDQSDSMTAPEFPAGQGVTTRLDAAKRTFARFVARRPDDLIGLVGFARFPDLLAPPQLDHTFVLEAAARLEPARPGDDGTNLGDAVLWSIDALNHAPSKQKVLIILSDGQNRPGLSGAADPTEAAGLAREHGITLHAIAVGDPSGRSRPQEPETGLPLPAEGPDVDLLGRMARMGGGRLFLATDVDSLEAVFREIDRLETSPVRGTIKTRYREEFAPWVGFALVLLGVDRLLSTWRLKRIP